MSRTILKALYIADIAAMFILFFIFRMNMVALYVVTGVCLAVGLFLTYKLRCPHCGAWPRKGSLFHEYCSKCGQPLDE